MQGLNLAQLPTSALACTCLALTVPRSSVLTMIRDRTSGCKSFHIML